MNERVPYDRLRRDIVRLFAPFDPERIVLFGSLARGEGDEFSDVDLVVVYPTEKRFLDRLEELYACWTLPVAVDVLAYTPDEYRKMLRESAFLQDVVAEGEVIYERPVPRGEKVDPPGS